MIGDRGTALRDARTRARGLALLGGVLDDAPGRAVLALLDELGGAAATAGPDAARVAARYGAAFHALAVVADDEPVPELEDAWQAHLTARLLDDVNPWSGQAEGAGAAAVAPGLRAQARHDLRALKALFDLDAAMLLSQVRVLVDEALPPLAGAWIPWRELTLRGAPDSGHPARAALRRRLAETPDWGLLADDLAEYWAHHGSGVVGRYRALRWDAASGKLRGIQHPDPVLLHHLVAYQREQRILADNLERFLTGLPAQDALLYGPPGTGKSSTVKALAHSYAERGLRLLEVRKDDLADLPAIAAAVRGHAPRFLLFVDDLSFEEHETEYKALKAVLEGTAEQRPHNLLIHATSNRRNLVRETFADRGATGGEVHERDTLQEKISLAARFGLRVTFAAPDQERYLTIVSALARQRNIDVPDDQVRSRALLWERQHPGRSGRTAHQFVDELEADTRASRPRD